MSLHTDNIMCGVKSMSWVYKDNIKSTSESTGGDSVGLESIEWVGTE